MSLFYPTMMFEKISDILPETLDVFGISALILDVDNTLTSHNNPVPAAHVIKWLELMRESGIKLIIASNNTGKRVKPFAGLLSLDYAANSAKPLPIGFLRVAKRLNLPAKSFGIVGDQIFTDILGGNLFGAKTFLVQPIEPENNPLIKLKRIIEVPIIRDYLKKKKEKG